jgi:2-dehydro-3-deoxyglucarate aldolase/4-hydroxy-2-oxoheptanedioate aldolase
LKYPPDGIRGVALGLAHDNYRAAPVAQALAAANRTMCFVALIETADGVENVDAICAENGVDAIWIGHLDLSTSLGVPGAFEDPVFTLAMERIMAAAKAHGVAVGQLVDSPAAAVARHGQGSDLICYSGDVWLLRNALSDGFARIRSGLDG